jgi:hypothetical protein
MHVENGGQWVKQWAGALVQFQVLKPRAPAAVKENPVGSSFKSQLPAIANQR